MFTKDSMMHIPQKNKRFHIWQLSVMPKIDGSRSMHRSCLVSSKEQVYCVNFCSFTSSNVPSVAHDDTTQARPRPDYSWMEGRKDGWPQWNNVRLFQLPVVVEKRKHRRSSSSRSVQTTRCWRKTVLFRRQCSDDGILVY
jgi:hypothetical protein